MSQHFLSLARWRLLDGRELHIETDGVHVGDRLFTLTQMREARLLFLRPETLALSMRDVGQVEFSFARQGDGVAALETLYHLRPDLRRADAPAPALDPPPGYLTPPATPPLTPQSAPPGQLQQPAAGAIGPYGPYGPFYAPPRPDQPTYPAYSHARLAAPAPFPPQTLAAYGAQPNRDHAELTPAPRSAGGLIGAAFRLWGKRLGALLLVTLLVSTLPTMGIAILDAIVSALGGVNPLAGVQNPLPMLQQAANGQSVTGVTSSPAATAPTALSNAIGLLSLIAVTLTVIVAAWSQASLVIAAREATLGRPISVGACLREGMSRIWPTLWALCVLYAVLGLIAVPGLGLALTFALAPTSSSTAAQIPAQDAPAFYAIAVALTLGTLLAIAYAWSRLALYPVAAALGAPQPFRLSLGLTSYGWLRVFAALLVVTLLTGGLTLGVNAAQLLSVAVATIVLAPLAQLIIGPLGALIRVVTLYDQRLRREGYALFMAERISPPQQAQRAAATEPEHHSELGS